MARKKSKVAVISKAQTAREFHLTWYQVDYWFRKFDLRPIATPDRDRRASWFRRDQVVDCLQHIHLKRAS